MPFIRVRTAHCVCARCAHALTSQRSHESALSRVKSFHASTVRCAPLSRYAEQLEELSDELYAESASLYEEFGVPLQEGLRAVNRHLRAHRLIAAAATLRPVEKMITQARLASCGTLAPTPTRSP